MNWYDFIGSDVSGDYNAENNHREIMSVASAFKRYSMHNRKDVYKYTFFVPKKDLDIFKGVLSKHFKFNRLVEYDSIGDNQTELMPFIYYSSETYINGTSANGSDYSFIIYTLNEKTYSFISSKLKEAKTMNEALA